MLLSILGTTNIRAARGISDPVIFELHVCLSLFVFFVSLTEPRGKMGTLRHQASSPFVCKIRLPHEKAKTEDKKEIGEANDAIVAGWAHRV
jgi:hypothetical protein